MRKHTCKGASLALATVMAGLAGLLAPAAGAAPDERVAEPASAVRDYWTPTRMRAAEPLDAAAAAPETDAATGPQPLVGGAPSYVAPADAKSPARARMRAGSPGASRLPGLISQRVENPADPSVSAHGRVFFTIPSGPYRGDYVCSGTAVNSRNRSTVWTAGHCVYELTGGGFVTNWTFVPAYESGAAPYGEWPAKRLTAPRAYQTSQNLHFDFGAAVVRTNAEGQRLQSLVGARGIAFDQPRDQDYLAYGYPKELPFDGEHEYTCDSDMQSTDQFAGDGPPTMSIRCDMTAGASGGGWIVNGSILSDTSYGYTTRPFELYGPYLSSAAKNVYREASGKRKKKGGKKGHKGGKGNKGGKRR